MRIKGKVLLMALGCLSVASADVKAIEIDNEWLPELNGTLRPRYEWSTETGDMRFQVRNARIGLNGHVSSYVTYRAEIDFCDRGVVKCLDVWARLAITKMVAVQVGQMRMPFTMGSYRAPHQYLFANRPITDRQVASPRNVGAKGMFTLPGTGFSVEAGVYNTTSNSNHQVWQEHLGYAGKARYIVANHLTLLAGAQSTRPGDVRLNDLSGAISWDDGRFLLEGEYVYRHPVNKTFAASHAYNFMVDYGMPAKIGYFNRVSFQGRWDGMTDTWDGTSATAYPARNRVTLGSTLSYIKDKVRTDFRLNFEQCFFHKGVTPTADDGNKLVAEVCVHF